MAAITCKDFLDRLESWMEGDVHSDSQGHLRNCPHCRSLVDDLKDIRSEALSWRAEEAEPPARVWTNLRSQLEQEGLIRENRPAESPKTTWFGRGFASLPRP